MPQRHQPGQPQLLQILGAVFGLAVGIGSMIGAGILRTPGTVAQLAPSVAWIVGLWLFAAVHSLLGANVAAELFTEVREAGGIYVPVRRAFGPLAGSLIGWADIINNAAASSALALAGVDFLAMAWPGAHDRALAIALGIILALFVINALGVREGRAAQVTMTVVKIAILIVIAAAALVLPPVHFTNALPVAGVSVAGAVAAYQLILGAYSGWVNPAYFVEEDVAPKRNIPRVLFATVLAVAALYLVINLVLLRIMPLSQLAHSAVPVGDIIGRLAGRAGTFLLGATGFILILGCCNAGLMVSPRIVFGLARDGLFPRWGMQVSRSGTPQLGLALVTVVSIALLATGSFEAAFRVLATSGAVTLLALDISLFRLRLCEPELERPFAAIGYPYLPAATVVLDTAVLMAMFWFDPTSAAITIGILGFVALAWGFVAARTRMRASPTSAQ